MASETTRGSGILRASVILESADLGTLPPEIREAALNAAGGLTTIEAENAFALSVIESGSIQPAIVAREKAHALKKTGLLEVIETTETLESIGGLDALKAWVFEFLSQHLK